MKILRLAYLGLSLVTVLGMITPSVSAFASVNSISRSTSSKASISITANTSMSITSNLTDGYTYDYKSELKAAIRSTVFKNYLKSKIAISKSGKDTTLIFTDTDFSNALLQAGFIMPTNRKNGVTKVVVHGDWKKGNIDIYLSSTVCKTVLVLGVAAGLVGVVVAAAGSLSNPELIPVLTNMLYNEGAAVASAIAAVNTKNGHIFIFKGWHYSHMINQ